MPITTSINEFASIYRKNLGKNGNILCIETNKISKDVFLPDISRENKDIKILYKNGFQINSNPILTITPISSDNRNKANIDYEEQLSRISEGKSLVWDDSKYNQSKSGDLFGFWKYKNEVLIHVIEKVFSPLERLPSWSSNVAQGNRNVIQLSKNNFTIPWEKWIELDGAKRCMGTSPVKKGLSKILDYITN